MYRRPVRRQRLVVGMGSLAAVLLLAALLAIYHAGSTSPGQRSATSGPPLETGFGTWSPTYMSDDHTYTRAEAVALARRVDLVAALPTTFSQYVDVMRAANPHLVLLAYTNAMLLAPAQAGDVPNEWFARDSEGQQIRSQQFGQYLMDAGQAGWRNFSTGQCTSNVRRSGYDGCLVDMLTMGVFARQYLSSALDGSESDPDLVQRRYQQNLVRLARQFGNLPAVIVAGNTVTSAPRYFAREAGTRAVAAQLRLNQAEDFLRSANDPARAFPNVADWRADIAVLQDLTRLGSQALVTTKLWVPASNAVSEQWQRFSIASFLLGAGSGSYYSYTSSRTRDGATGVHDTYRLPQQIGDPVGAMVTWQGLYARPFTGGLVLVNPTSSPGRATLPASLHSWDGADTSQVVVPPHDGTVLLGRTPALQGARSVPAPSGTTADPPTTGSDNAAPIS